MLTFSRPVDNSEQLKATVVPAQLRAPVQASPTAPEKPSLPFSQFTFTILGEILRCAVLRYSSGRVEGRHRPVNQLIAVIREAAKTDNILTVCGDLTLTTSPPHPAHPRGPPLPPGALHLPQNFPFSPSPPLIYSPGNAFETAHIFLFKTVCIQEPSTPGRAYLLPPGPAAGG